MKTTITIFLMLLALNSNAIPSTPAQFNVVPTTYPGACNAIVLENLAADAGTNQTWTFNPAAINAATGLPVTSMVVNSSTLGIPPVWPIVYWTGSPSYSALTIGYKGKTQVFNTCDCNTFASGSFFNAPLVCNIDHYCGNTAAAYIEDFLQNGSPLGGLGANGDGCLFCGSYTTDFSGSIENNSWLQFIAAASSVTFNIQVESGCEMQFGVYAYNPAAPLGTNGVLTLMTPLSWTAVDGFTGNQTITANGLTPGNQYYLLFDGDGGQDCDYELGFTSGIVTVDALASDYLVCAGDAVTLTATPAVSSASYVWTDNFGNTYPNASSIVVNPSANTTYSVEVILSGCDDEPQDVVVAIEPCPLPLQMGDISVECLDNETRINWQTITELNTNHFEIERADNSGVFRTIATIDASGNSFIPVNYEYVDQDRISQQVYYRIKTIDLDGTESISDIFARSSCSSGSDGISQVYFSDDTKEISINYSVVRSTELKLKIVDLRGNVVLGCNVVLEPQFNQVKIDASTLTTTSIYVTNIETDNQSIIERIFVK